MKLKEVDGQILHCQYCNRYEMEDGTMVLHKHMDYQTGRIYVAYKVSDKIKKYNCGQCLPEATKKTEKINRKPREITNS